MANKNRSARFSDFKHGVTVYQVWGEQILKRFILGRPFKRNNSWWVNAIHHLFANEVDQISFGDSGLANYHYDDRLPQLFMSRSAAERALPMHLQEQQARIDQRSNDGFIFSDYGDYDWTPHDQAEANHQLIDRFNGYEVELKRPWELEFKFPSSNHDVMFSDDVYYWYGALFAGPRINVEFLSLIEDQSKLIDPPSKYLLLYNGVWYDMWDNVDLWLRYDGMSPREKSKAKFTTPLTDVYQKVLEKIVVLTDRKIEEVA